MFLDVYLWVGLLYLVSIAPDYTSELRLWILVGLLILGFIVLRTLYPADYGFFYTGSTAALY
jgi:hypothetical protein